MVSLISDLDIVSIIRGYLPNLVQKGSVFVDLCPFHEEKTPSFKVSPSKNIFHCFGCGKGGNVVSFVMEIDQCSYGEAIHKLESITNVQIQTRYRTSGKQHFQMRASYLEIMSVASKFYHQNLFKNKFALDYFLKKRQLTLDVIKFFQLGWAGTDNCLLHHLVQKGYSYSQLQKVGLIRPSRYGESYQDLFYERVMFPIVNLSGHVVAFGGRVLNQDTNPKYINSPDMPLFHKKDHLYGLFQSKKSIFTQRKALIVEGYMDVVSAFQFGYKGVVAPLGTALTDKQISLLKQYVQHITLSFDSDHPGQECTFKVSQGLMRHDFFPSVLSFGPYKDLDACMHGQSQLSKKMDLDEVNCIQFQIQYLEKKFQHIPELSRQNIVIQEILKPMEQFNLLIQEQIIRFLSGYFSISVDLLWKMISKSSAQQSQSQMEEKKSSWTWLSLEEEILSILIEDEACFNNFFKIPRIYLFSDKRVIYVLSIFEQNCDYMNLDQLIEYLCTYRVSQDIHRKLIPWLSSLNSRRPASESDKISKLYDDLIQNIERIDQQQRRKLHLQRLVGKINGNEVLSDVDLHHTYVDQN